MSELRLCPICNQAWFGLNCTHKYGDVFEYAITLRKQLEDALRGSKDNADWFACLKIDYDIAKKQLEVSDKVIKDAEYYMGVRDKQLEVVTKASIELINFRDHNDVLHIQLVELDDYINQLRESLYEINRIGGMNVQG